MLIVPLGELQILAQIVKTWRHGHPLDGMHPDRITGKPCPPTYAGGGKIGAVRLGIQCTVNVFLVAVKPIFSHTFRLRDPSENSCVAHCLVAKRHTEQIHSAPALHRLRRRLLTIAIARVAESSGIGMSRPRRECAQPRKTLVGAVPIGIIFHYKTQHIAISGTEIVINKSKQRTGIGEVAVMEMMVVECVAVVTGVVAHKCAPAVVAGKEARFLARSIC